MPSKSLKPKTPEDIAAWAEQQDKPADSPAYSRVTAAELNFMRQLHRQGKTQTEIAQQLKRGQSTVSYWLNALEDTSEVATEYLRGSALRMAENIVKNGLARDHVQVLNGLSVLNATDSKGINITINGMHLHGTGQLERGPVVEAEILSPPVSDDLHRLTD